MKTSISLLVVIVLAVGGYLFWQGRNSGTVAVSPSPTVSPLVSVSGSPTPVLSASPTATGRPTATPAVSVKTFTVTGQSYSFSPSTIAVNKGDTVRIVFNNVEGRHNWRLDEFSASTQVISAGQSETIQFVANKAGTFEYYCSVGAHRALGMKGTLTVR